MTTKQSSELLQTLEQHERSKEIRNGQNFALSMFIAGLIVVGPRLAPSEIVVLVILLFIAFWQIGKSRRAARRGRIQSSSSEGNN